MGNRLPVLAMVGLAVLGAVLFGSTGASGSTERAVAIDGFLTRHAGTRYGFGRCTPQAMDCSCFAQNLYRELWGYSIPRSTLTQASWLSGYRVPGVVEASHLREERLCVGDLIYTYQGRGWRSGSRHVAVYAGGGMVVHASKKNYGAGRDPLHWVQRFSLYGVFRPLQCEVPGPPGRSEAPLSREAEIRRLVARYYATWMVQDLESFRQFWATDAQQVHNGRTLDLDQIVGHRRNDLVGLQQGTAYHDIRSLGITEDRAFVDVDYSLYREYGEHRREDLNRRETLIFEREKGAWKIILGEDPAGD